MRRGLFRSWCSDSCVATSHKGVSFVVAGGSGGARRMDGGGGGGGGGGPIAARNSAAGVVGVAMTGVLAKPPTTLVSMGCAFGRASVGDQ